MKSSDHLSLFNIHMGYYTFSIQFFIILLTKKIMVTYNIYSSYKIIIIHNTAYQTNTHGLLHFFNTMFYYALTKKQ